MELYYIPEKITRVLKVLSKRDLKSNVSTLEM